MAKKREYYSIDNLKATEARYNLLIGMNNNGKSYQVKLLALNDAYEKHINFVYLRRWREDIKTAYIESYFDDMPIDKITNGEYTHVFAWQSYLYFGTMGEDGKAKRGAKIGRYCALNEYQRYKSTTFVNYRHVVFEEFITDDVYLTDEPLKLMRFVTIVARGDAIRVWMIGNTMSRVVPYFSEWCLKGSLNQQPGTIDIYNMKYGDETIKIAVEMCAVIYTGSKMFFGKAAKQIVSGEWNAVEAAKLPGKQEDYEKAYKMQLIYKDFIFMLVLLVNGKTGERYIFIYPGKEKRKMRTICPDFSSDINTTATFNSRSRVESEIVKLFRENKVCYSDNMTGADFENVRKQWRIV